MYTPSRQKKRTRTRGWIQVGELTKSPKAEAVRADILDRLRQHEREDTLPRGGRGLFYDLRPHGMPDNSRGITYTKHPRDKGRHSTEATPDYVTAMLAEIRRVWDNQLTYDINPGGRGVAGQVVPASVGLRHAERATKQSLAMEPTPLL
jgi:hypothetical protein